MDQKDVVVYQVVAGVLLAAAIFAGCKFGGHYYRESRAHTIEISERPNTPEAHHAAALALAQGFKDTAGYVNMQQHLTSSEAQAAVVIPTTAEKYMIYFAIAGLVVGFLASHEPARVYARKRAAQGQVSRATQRFNNPRG